MQRELFGEKHPNIATSLHNLAGYHDALGNPRRALELGTEALAMLRESFGEKHPDIARSLHNLAFVYEKLDQHPAALKSGQAALAMRRELLGEAHPDTLGSLRFVAKRLYANPFTAKQAKELIADYLKYLPKDHPARAAVLNIQNARSGLRAQGKSPKCKQK
jgi:tetratricopeptide (TPR) repeat protein